MHLRVDPTINTRREDRKKERTSSERVCPRKTLALCGLLMASWLKDIFNSRVTENEIVTDRMADPASCMYLDSRPSRSTPGSLTVSPGWKRRLSFRALAARKRCSSSRLRLRWHGCKDIHELRSTSRLRCGSLLSETHPSQSLE